MFGEAKVAKKMEQRDKSRKNVPVKYQYSVASCRKTTYLCSWFVF